MPELENPSADVPRETPKTFRFSFSFGASPEQVRQAIEEARAEGVEPKIDVKEHVLEFKPAELLENLSKLEYLDPFRTIRKVLAWTPFVLFLLIVAAGVVIGALDRTLGPVWGGIFGVVLGGIIYQMMRPRGWWRSRG
jgi:hypothetical protein